MAKQYRYTYAIDMKFIFPDKSKFSVPVINKLTKHFNFAMNFFPIYECDCVVPLKEMTKIRSNQNVLYVILEITKRKFRSEENIEPESTEIILNHAFVPFFTPECFNPYVSSEVENVKAGSTDNPASSMGSRLKFALYSVNGLAANKKLLNYVADEADVGTMIKFLIDKTDIERCIIDKPDNTDTYKNLVVTPHNINMALKELQTRYGVYANGLSAFYDPPTLYVMNKFSLKHDYEKDKPNKLIFNCHTTNPGLQIGITPVLENDDKSLDYKVTCAPKALNQDVANSEILGNEVIFSNITLTTNMMEFEEGKISSFSFPTSTIKSDSISHEKTGNKSLVDYDETNNPYNISALLKSANLGTLIVINRIIGVDLETFKPNTTITLNVVDDNVRNNEFAGVYSIVSGSITYAKNRPDIEDMICAVEGLVLSRMDS